MKSSLGHAVGRQIAQRRECRDRTRATLIKKRKDCKRGEDGSSTSKMDMSATPEVSVEDVLEHGALDSDADPQSNSKESENKYTAGPASLSPTTEGQGNKEETDLDMHTAEDAFDADTGAVLGLSKNSEARKARLVEQTSSSSLDGLDYSKGSSLLSRLLVSNSNEVNNVVRLCQMKRPARSLTALACYITFSETAFPEKALPKVTTLDEARFHAGVGGHVAVNDRGKEETEECGENLMVVGTKEEKEKIPVYISLNMNKPEGVGARKE